MAKEVEFNWKIHAAEMTPSCYPPTVIPTTKATARESSAQKEPPRSTNAIQTAAHLASGRSDNMKLAESLIPACHLGFG
jgi:hypothetical protein